jgi:hypothetical protein
MTDLFSVGTKGGNQLEDAVASYVFSLISLGVKIPTTNLGVHELETKAQTAFSDVLENLVVRIHVNAVNDICVRLI